MGHHGSHPRPRLGAAALLAVVAACSSANTPATTPTTTEAPSTTASTAAPATTTTTTGAVANDRLAEIQAIFQDLEERRLDALYRGDVEAFKALFANEAYMEQDVGSFQLVEFTSRPTLVLVSIDKVVRDDDGCIAIEVLTNYSAFFGPDAEGGRTVVLQPMAEGWGYSYVGEGWTCDGPHPLGP